MNETVDLSIYRETLLFLATAGVVAPLFFRLRISPVLGFLLGGRRARALRPRRARRAGAVARRVRASPMSRRSTGIAAFGVVALLFTMGLELSFERLRRMRRLVFGLGLGQVVVTTLALAAVACGSRPAAGLRADHRRGARACRRRRS